MDKMLHVLWENVLDDEQTHKTGGDLSQELETYMTQSGSPSVSGKPINFKRLSSLLCLTLSLTGCTQTDMPNVNKYAHEYVYQLQPEIGQGYKSFPKTDKSSPNQWISFGEFTTIWRITNLDNLSKSEKATRSWLYGPMGTVLASMGSWVWVPSIHVKAGCGFIHL